MRLLAPLTLALWLALTSNAFAASSAYSAGKIAGYLFMFVLVVALVVWVVRRAGGRR